MNYVPGDNVGTYAFYRRDGEGQTFHDFVVEQVCDRIPDVHEGVALASEIGIDVARRNAGDNGWTGHIYRGVDGDPNTPYEETGFFYSRTDTPEKPRNDLGDTCSRAIVYLWEQPSAVPPRGETPAVAAVCRIEPPLAIV